MTRTALSVSQIMSKHLIISARAHRNPAARPGHINRQARHSKSLAKASPYTVTMGLF